MLLKRSFVIALSVFIALFLAACGNSSTTGGGSYGSGSSATVLQTATVTVKGHSELVLTDAQGMTLYYYSADSATQSTCSSSCAQRWHPLLFTGAGEPSSATPLAGNLSLHLTKLKTHLISISKGRAARGKRETNGRVYEDWVCTRL